jgi:hypothetical protein
LACIALLAAGACKEQARLVPPPADRFYFPSGIALRHVKPGTNTTCDAADIGVVGQCTTQLFVASANFDLRFAGGTLIAVKDVDQAITTATQQTPNPLTPAFTDAQPIGSNAGEVAILDDESCQGSSAAGYGPQVMVTSGSENRLYRFDLAAEPGTLLGDPALLPLGEPIGSGLVVKDPYGIALACGHYDNDAISTLNVRAYVGYLDVEVHHGGLGQIDLAPDGTASAPRWVDLGITPARSAVFDPATTRLFVSDIFTTTAFSPVRWLTLADPSPTFDLVNLEDSVRGAVPKALALSTDGTRLYVALTLYDVSAATFSGTLPSVGIGGALAILQSSTGPDGAITFRTIRVVPMPGRGTNDLRVIPRAGSSDLVAVIGSDDSTLAFYDDATGTVANVFGVFQDAVCGSDANQRAPAPCELGKPLLGLTPWGMASEVLSGGNARLYIGSFNDGWINVITFNPATPQQPPISWARIGPEMSP